MQWLNINFATSAMHYFGILAKKIVIVNYTHGGRI
jgi:hypothetical protein